MPQVSPISWVTIFLMLTLYFFLLFSTSKKLPSPLSEQVTVKNKENPLAW